MSIKITTTQSVSVNSPNFLLKKKFEDLVEKTIFEFNSNAMFAPIGLELAITPVKVQVNEDYGFIELTDKVKADDLPIAYYNPRTNEICVYVQHPTFLCRNEQEQEWFFKFLLYHEISHRILLTDLREHNRQHQLWNVATDLEIHNVLKMYDECIKGTYCRFMGLFTHAEKYLFDQDNKLSCGLFEPQYLVNTAEEIYADLLRNQTTKTKTFEVNLNGGGGNGGNSSQGEDGQSGNVKVQVEITETTLPSGKKIRTTDVNFPDYDPKNAKGGGKDGDDTNSAENRSMRKAFAETAMRNGMGDAKSRGTVSREMQTLLDKMFRVKVDWKKILESALHSILEKTEERNWARPSTSVFALPDPPYLPSRMMDEEKYATIVICRDESGSITDEECAEACDVVLQSKDKFKNLIVLKHDTEIKEQLVFGEDELTDADTKSIMKRVAGGGTSHRDCFRFIDSWDANHSEEPISVVIFITDMYSDIEECQGDVGNRIPLFYLVPDGNRYDASAVNGTVLEMNKL